MKIPIFYYKSNGILYIKNGKNNAIIQLPTYAIEDAKNNPDASVYLNRLLHKYGFWDNPTHCNSNILQIILSVSNACNLHCAYCFEKEKNSTILTRERSEEFLRFINSKCNDIANMGIDLTFTGGEPFFNPHEIGYIISHLSDYYSSSHKLEVSYITNGTIYNQQVSELLKTYPGEIQITLDGYRHSHDAYRIGKSKNSTFDLICRNIDNILFETGCQVIIRINAITKNKTDYGELLEFLHHRWGSYYRSGRISHYLAFLDVDADNSDLHFTKNDRLELLYFITKKEIDLGFLIKETVISGGNCMIRNSNGYTIDADGFIYDCFSFVGDLNYSIGHISDKYHLIRSIQEFMCMEHNCSFYANCYGGCIYSNYVQTGQIKPVCEKDYLIAANKIYFAMSLYQRGLIQLMNFTEVMENVFFDEIDF